MVRSGTEDAVSSEASWCVQGLKMLSLVTLHGAFRDWKCCLVKLHGAFRDWKCCLVKLHGAFRDWRCCFWWRFMVHSGTEDAVSGEASWCVQGLKMLSLVKLHGAFRDWKCCLVKLHGAFRDWRCCFWWRFMVRSGTEDAVSGEASRCVQGLKMLSSWGWRPYSLWWSRQSGTDHSSSISRDDVIAVSRITRNSSTRHVGRGNRITEFYTLSIVQAWTRCFMNESDVCVRVCACACVCVRACVRVRNFLLLDFLQIHFKILYSLRF